MNLHTPQRKIENFQNIFIFQAKLAILQQERDLALAENRQLADEIQTIRIYYR
jgi:hypothetical protein